jgi:transcription antitermination factor NusG
VSAASSWHILRIIPNMEKRAHKMLAEANVTAYLPIETAWVFLPRDRKAKRTRALFPGYLFAELPNDEVIDVARGNRTVREIMCRDGRPVTLPPIVIGSMALLEAWRVFDLTWTPPLTGRRNKRRGRKPTTQLSRWENGERVRLTTGPFAKFEGTIMRTDRGARIEVLIAVFGRPTLVAVSDAQVEHCAELVPTDVAA